MLFAAKFSEITEILDVRFKALYAGILNAADKGELCETFIKDMLCEILSRDLQVFRGGTIVDSKESQSRQMDVVVTWGSALRIFADKGFYPVESVCAAFCITATLTKQKLQEDVTVLASIPSDNPAFLPSTEGLVQSLFGDRKYWDLTMERWKRVSPYRCIFAFSGNPQADWRDFLNQQINSGVVERHRMPDVIVVNKRGIFHKINPSTRDDLTDRFAGVGADKHYAYVPFEAEEYWQWFPLILNGLTGLGRWQYLCYVNYGEYFK